MSYTNKQILSAVVAEWAKPAVSQLATNRLGQLSIVKAIENMVVGSGLVGSTYTLAGEILPFVKSGIDAIMIPVLENALSKIPDEAVPALARSIVRTAKMQPDFSLLGGILQFDCQDLDELDRLIELNMPLAEAEQDPAYIVKH